MGRQLHGGEVLELISDLGGGKTTFISGLVAGFGSPDTVASPSFTLSYVYGRADRKQVHHFDFYRLSDAGVVGDQLADLIGDKMAVIAVEWGDIVHAVLPDKRIRVTIDSLDESTRIFTFEYPRDYHYLFRNV